MIHFCTFSNFSENAQKIPKKGQKFQSRDKISKSAQPQIRLLPHKRTKNDQAMIFYVTAAGIALTINYRTKQKTN